jgi:hypothetical protein
MVVIASNCYIYNALRVSYVDKEKGPEGPFGVFCCKVFPTPEAQIRQPLETVSRLHLLCFASSTGFPQS